ncbi:hypothetical protein FRC03_009619 [Tulasnella sp. 419]|nr:hypothetical protein FRC03_009619 [Tulasnella sp. 419]
MEYLKYDELTVSLGLIAAALYVASRIQQPAPLAHPMLLGRQVDATQVRKPEESAVYRNFGTGQNAPLPTRPTIQSCTVIDFLLDEHTGVRSLWSTQVTNAQLKEKIHAFTAGVLKLTNIAPRDANVLMLLDDCFEFVVTDLAFASLSVPTLTLTRLNILSSVLDTYPPSAIVVQLSFLDPTLELLSENKETQNITVIVVGDHNKWSDDKGKRAGVNVVRWEDLVEAGLKSEEALPKIDPPEPTDVFTVSFTGVANDHPIGTQLTHMNITAGVAALQHIFPMAKAFTQEDHILSSHSLSTAFGRSLLYTALLRGSSFSTVASTKIFEPIAPNLEEVIRAGESKQSTPPTVLFLTTRHYNKMVEAILNHARQSWLFGYAWRHKVYALSGGDLSNNTIWDKLVFAPARTKALGRIGSSMNRALFTGDPIPSSQLNEFRIALSVPVVRATIHPQVAGPVFACHPFDLQSFPEDTEEGVGCVAHCGPPSINVEVKLKGVNDEAISKGEDPVGQVLARGPSIGAIVPPDEEPAHDGWVNLGLKAKVGRNGTFHVLRS